MNAPRVCVVLPVWGRHGAHVGAALDSLAAQRTPLSLVIVEDGPQNQDGRAAIDRHRGLARAVAVHEKNLGTAAALNTGFDLADRGAPYWTWVQSDCVMHPTWLERQVAFLDSNPDAALVYSNYWREPGRLLGSVPPAPPIWVPEGQSLSRFPRVGKLVDTPNCPIGPAFLFRRRLAELVGAQRGRIAHDYDWFLRCEEVCDEHGWTIDHLDAPLCDYRVHPDRATEALADQNDARHWQEEARKRRALTSGARPA